MRYFLKKVLFLCLLSLGFLCWVLFQPVWVSAQQSPVAVSVSALEEHVYALTGTPQPRNFQHSHSLDSAGSYIESIFEGYTARVERQNYKGTAGDFFNVIARFGPEEGKRIVVGAHYDVCYDQPGADDNASGVAGMLELARLLSENESVLQQPVELVAFSLEEPPFFRTYEMGSFIHAKSLKDAGAEVEMMLSVEMIGYYSDEKGSQGYPLGIMKAVYPSKANYIAVVGKLGGGKPIRRAKRAMRKYTDIPCRSMSGPSFIPGIDFSDHLNYWHFGFPAAMITDTSFYRNDNYHQETDTPETLNFEKMAEVVKGIYHAVIG